MAKNKINPDTDSLSQNDIDALLGGGDDDGAEMNQGAIDALLGVEASGDASEPSAPGNEMDQDLIDALLGGGFDAEESTTPPPPPPAETDPALDQAWDQNAIDALLGSDNAETPGKTTPQESKATPPGGELDQSLIDALLGGGIDAEDSATPPPPTPVEVSATPGEEMDQSAIDALLGNDTAETPGKAAPQEQKAALPGGELDQSLIDALLGGGIDAENIPVTPAASAAPSHETTGELDQSDIDALLGGAVSAQSTAKKQAGPAKPVGNLGVEMDQSDIDALLGGGDADHTQLPSQAEDFGELDQATIDALMGGGDTEESKPVRATDTKDDDFGELDQATIDALMGGGGDDPSVSTAPPRSALKKGMDEKPATPEQDEIDQLFSGGDESPDYTLDAFASEGEDEVFKEIFDKTTDTDISALKGGTDTDTGDETLGFEEELFASDEKTIAEPAHLSAEKDIFSDDEASETAQVVTDKARKAGKKSFFPMMRARAGKMAKAAAAISLAGILGVAVYFYILGHHGNKMAVVPQPPITEQHPAAVAPEQPAPTPAPVVTVNHAPLIADNKYYLSEAHTALSIQLTGKDDDNDTLKFEIIAAPQYGELSGTPPALTYTPRKDFPGEDLFEYRAGDGRDFSAPAKVTIARLEPPVAPKAAVTQKTPSPKKMVRAEDVTLHTTSTKELDIDWQTIWEKFNRLPFSRVVQVEVVKTTRHGRLHRLSATRYQYQPEPYFAGQDELEYRFKLGAAFSQKKKLRLLVGMGNHRPEIKLAAIAPSYKPGATVLLDASQSRDEEREGLTFTWELLSGVPVQMAFKNREGSKASFVMPSTFRSMPGLVIRLSAIDRQGQSDSKEIRIATDQPAEETALWHGSIKEGPDCGLDRCSDGLRHYGD